MKIIHLNNVLCFDCETTGVPEKGMKWDEDFLRFPRPVTMAWAFGDTEKHEIIRPQGWDIPTETVAIHGVTTEQADKEGKPFVEVVTEFLNDAEKCPLICAHNIYFDTSIIKAAIMALCPELADKAESALFKGKRIDTMYKTIKFVGSKYPMVDRANIHDLKNCLQSCSTLKRSQSITHWKMYAHCVSVCRHWSKWVLLSWCRKNIRRKFRTQNGKFH